MVAEHCGTRTALRPIAARHVLVGEPPTVGLRTGQDIVHVRRVASTVHRLPCLGERGFLVEIVLAVKLGHIAGDEDALDVMPWAWPDTVARVDRGFSAGRNRAHAEIGMPSAVASAHCLGQRLAMLIRAV